MIDATWNFDTLLTKEQLEWLERWGEAIKRAYHENRKNKEDKVPLEPINIEEII